MIIFLSNNCNENKNFKNKKTNERKNKQIFRFKVFL